jgi:hypothetical protein
MKFDGKGFVNLSDQPSKRQGNWPRIKKKDQKIQEYYLTWGKGVSVIKGGIESSPLRAYVQETSLNGDQSNKKQNTSKDSEFIQKKLRKTKHNMFRFQHNKLHL